MFADSIYHSKFYDLNIKDRKKISTLLTLTPKSNIMRATSFIKLDFGSFSRVK